MTFVCIHAVSVGGIYSWVWWVLAGGRMTRVPIRAKDLAGIIAYKANLKPNAHHGYVPYITTATLLRSYSAAHAINNKETLVILMCASCQSNGLGALFKCASLAFRSPRSLVVHSRFASGDLPFFKEIGRAHV